MEPPASSDEYDGNAYSAEGIRRRARRSAYASHTIRQHRRELQAQGYAYGECDRCYSDDYDLHYCDENCRLVQEQKLRIHPIEQRMIDEGKITKPNSKGVGMTVSHPVSIEAKTLKVLVVHEANGGTTLRVVGDRGFDTFDLGGVVSEHPIEVETNIVPVAPERTATPGRPLPFIPQGGTRGLPE